MGYACKESYNQGETPPRGRESSRSRPRNDVRVAEVRMVFVGIEQAARARSRALTAPTATARFSLRRRFER
jgi:hypothetical protein